MTFCLFTNFCCSVSQTADWQGTKQRGQHVHSRGHHLYNAFHADIPHRHTFQCQLSLLFIICPKTKNHPLLASATRSQTWYWEFGGKKSHRTKLFPSLCGPFKKKKLMVVFLLFSEQLPSQKSGIHPKGSQTKNNEKESTIQTNQYIIIHTAAPFQNQTWI